MNFFLLGMAAVLLGWALTGLVLRRLSGARHTALPNDRSMHVAPTPTGGGLAIVGSIGILLAVWLWPVPMAMTVVVATMVGLAIISALDQYYAVWPLTRLLAQGLAVAICLSLLPATLRLSTDLDLGLERCLIGLAWLWLINLTNFMDGIDGLAGAQGVAIAVGYIAIVLWPFGGAPAMTSNIVLAVAMAGTCLGYLIWNWHPARIFMGDAGSIPLGFLMGWLLLDLAHQDKLVAAVLLPLTFVADASVTLMRRLFAGAMPWRPHRTHFYQRAVSGGASPRVVVASFAVANAVLIGLAIQASAQPLAALAGAGCVVLALAATLRTLAQTRERSKSP